MALPPLREVPQGGAEEEGHLDPLMREIGRLREEQARLLAPSPALEERLGRLEAMLRSLRTERGVEEAPSRRVRKSLRRTW
jgi:hypothetical protein